MRIIKIGSSNEDSFKYAILYSQHYDDVSRNPERISKLKPFENKYNFSYNTRIEFEMNNLSISLTIFDENEKIIYSSNNFTLNKANIVKINNHRYAGIRPLKDNFIKLKELLQSFSHSELSDPRVQNIFRKYIEYHK